MLDEWGTVSQADTCRPREKIPNPDTVAVNQVAVNQVAVNQVAVIKIRVGLTKRYQIPELSSSPVFFNDFEDWNGLTGRYVSASRKDTKS